MADTFSKEKRSWIMSRIRGRDTKPEKAIRSQLHRLGYRFRLHRNDLPGRPDIVLPKYRTVLFVHGCFWHQHNECKRATVPKSNEQYWIPKLKRNVSRFQQAKVALKDAGWKVVVIWECETKDLFKLEEYIDSVLKK
jgi:DNA mismatch endonuclease (patch repair protein)